MVKRALQLTGPGSFDIVTMPIGKPEADEVVVAVEAVTTCPQWDMHLWRGEQMLDGVPLYFPYMPGQPGHEMVGRVIDKGAAVHDLAIGQRVAAWRDGGAAIHGCYATHVTRKAEQLLPMPDDLPATACSSLELAMCVSTVFMDLKLHGFLPCRSMAVAGLGPAGLIAMQMAEAHGIERVMGFDLDANRRAYAATLGYGDIGDPSDADNLPTRHEADAFDISIECVGHVSAFEFLGDHTRDIVALFGVQRSDYIYKRDYCWAPPLRIWGYPPHNRAAGEYARKLILAGQLDLTPLATHTVPLRDYDKAVDLLLSRTAVKVCLLCDEANC